jgi:hypothetical protein
MAKPPGNFLLGELPQQAALPLGIPNLNFGLIRDVSILD